MTEKPEEIFHKIQQAMRSAREHNIEYIQEVLKKIQHLLLTDFEFAIQKQVYAIIWQTMRETIEPVRLSKSKGLLNVLNMCVAFLSDLCLLLQAEYGLIMEFVPSFISLSSAVAHKSKNKRISEQSVRSFSHFVSLRLGDIFRYKDELVLAENCYKTAIRADPSNGSVWNQMSLIAQSNAKFSDKLYYSARAVHTEKSFESATTNTASLLKKFSDDESCNETSPFHIQYVHLLSKLHFLQPIEPYLIKCVGKNLHELRHLVPLFSLLNSFCNSEDEERTTAQIHSLLCEAFSNTVRLIVEKEDSLLLWSLCLLLRLPKVCSESEDLRKYLEKEPDTQLVDSFHLQHFNCFPDPFSYPVTHLQISAVVQSSAQESSVLKSVLAVRQRTVRTVLCAPKSHEQ